MIGVIVESECKCRHLGCQTQHISLCLCTMLKAKDSFDHSSQVYAVSEHPAASGMKAGRLKMRKDGLMERSCDCGSFRAAMCSGMKVNLSPPQETRSIPAHSECQVQ
ncbi:hypothetical protein NQZ68_021723, partial [Dissostichus eleginoides]